MGAPVGGVAPRHYLGRLDGSNSSSSREPVPVAGGGRWRRKPAPPLAEKKSVVVRVVMRGECVVNHAVREIGRGAPLVLGGLVANAAASAVRVPSPRLVRSCRHLEMDSKPIVTSRADLSPPVDAMYNTW